jgi:hypothetical protein
MEWIAITIVCLAATFFGSGSNVSLNFSVYSRGSTVSSQVADDSSKIESDFAQDTKGGGEVQIPLTEWSSWDKWDTETKTIMLEWAEENNFPVK